MATKPAVSAAPEEQEETIETLVSDEFKRGARATAEAMKLYFLDENEHSIYDVSTIRLDSFADGAVDDTLRDEHARIKRDRI